MAQQASKTGKKMLIEAITAADKQLTPTSPTASGRLTEWYSLYAT